MSGPGRPRRLVVRFESQGDPSAGETQRAREAISLTAGARVLDELPGAFQVEVAGAAVQDLFQRMAQLPDWSVAEEGVVKMPDARRSSTSRKRDR